jgi:hypothetical protein
MNYIKLSAATVVVVVATTTPTYAYLDPGSASIVLQSIVAACAAGAATLGIYWNRVKGLFRRRTQDGEAPKGKK